MGPQECDWLERFQAELDNLRTALVWSSDGEGNPTQGLRLAAAPWRFWLTREGLTEGSDWLVRALARGSQAPQDARAEAAADLRVSLTTILGRSQLLER